MALWSDSVGAETTGGGALWQREGIQGPTPRHSLGLDLSRGTYDNC